MGDRRRVRGKVSTCQVPGLFRGGINPQLLGSTQRLERELHAGLLPGEEAGQGRPAAQRQPQHTALSGPLRDSGSRGAEEMQRGGDWVFLQGAPVSGGQRQTWAAIARDARAGAGWGGRARRVLSPG